MYIIKIYKRFLYEDIKFFLINFDNLVIKGKFGKVFINLNLYGFIKIENIFYILDKENQVIYE